MYINLNGTVASATLAATQGNTTTIAIRNQSNINAVLNAIGTEIRLYSDEQCTQLCGLYKSARVVRATYEPEKMLVSVTVQAAKVDDLTEEQLREEIAAQNAVISAQAAQITTLEDELEAAKILLGIEDEETPEGSEEE